jgi:hypothetical protein
MVVPKRVTCPYCWEEFEILIDTSVGTQSYTEDCVVCCHPVMLHIQMTLDGEITDVTANRE